MAVRHQITTLTTLRSEYLAWPAAHCGKRPPQRRVSKALCDSQSARLVMKIEVFCYNNPAPKTLGVHAGQREDKRIGMK